MHTVTRAVAAGMLALGLLGLGGCSSCSSQTNTDQSASSAPAATQTPVQDMAEFDENSQFTVPNVVSLTQADADKAILASGHRLGTVTTQSSDTVPLGCVISQDPKGLSQSKANSPVNLVISSGKEQAKEVQVPDLKGLSPDEARAALAKLGLVGTAGQPEQSTEVAAGKVFKQSIAAGTKVQEGTKVVYTVATAPAQTKATVPNVVGKSRDEAKAAITQANLGFDYTEAYSDKVAKDRVITQSVAAGSKVTPGTTVSVTVSLGAKPAANVRVPNVISYTWTDAEGALRSAGLTARYTGDPAGIVVAQDIVAGTEVAPYTLVTLTLARPVQLVAVPDLVGLSVTSAEIATDDLGLSLDIDGGFHGTVADQWPSAGTMVEQGTVVRVVIDSSDFTKVEVPDLVGESVTSAEIACDDLGFELKIDEGGIHGTVATQMPAPGEKVDPGTEIHITVDDSDFRGDGQSEVTGADYVGVWGCGRATLTITPQGNAYACNITWGSSASEVGTWDYLCTFTDGKLVDGGTGVKKDVVYSEDGEISSSETLYTNGSAEFSLDEQGRILWKDNLENAGADMAFTR